MSPIRASFIFGSRLAPPPVNHLDRVAQPVDLVCSDQRSTFVCIADSFGDDLARAIHLTFAESHEADGSRRRQVPRRPLA